MIYGLAEITKDVRVALDMNMSGEQLTAIADVDTLALDDIIRSKVCDAIKNVEANAPIHLVEGRKSLNREIVWNEDEQTCYMVLPSDFMRLVAFRMSDWERAVHSAITVADPLYALQSSKLRGIRGNPQKPVCAEVLNEKGKVLEIYSCRDTDSTVKEGKYLPLPSIENDKVEISPRCYRAVVYMTAALTASALSDNNKSAALTALAEAELKS